MTLSREPADIALDRLGALARLAVLGESAPVGLVLLDIVDFRAVNDAYGRNAGDALLQAVADRLRADLAPADGLFRVGDDEFAVVVAGSASFDQLAQRADRLLRLFHDGFSIGGPALPVVARAGIAWAASTADAEALWAHAAGGLSAAQVSGSIRPEAFRPELQAAAHARLELAADLRRAIEAAELVVHYQPIVDIASGALEGAEALVRWQHPERGLLLPVAFIELAEHAHLARLLGRFVLNRACADLARWRSRSVAAPRWMAVNVSAEQFLAETFVDEVYTTVHQHGLRAADIVLEVTEGVLLGDTPQLQAHMNALKAMGVSLVVDDFGTGFAGLEYFRRYGVDGLKIDRSFISALEETREQAAIVTAAVRFGDALDLMVIAEGIETQAQADWLVSAGCRHGQGYLFGRPAPLESWLA